MKAITKRWFGLCVSAFLCTLYANADTYNLTFNIDDFEIIQKDGVVSITPLKSSYTFDWDSFPFPNPLLGGWFVSRRLLLSQLHFYFVAPKSRSSFVANIRYIVYDCSSSIGQRCAGSIFAISNIGHHSAIVPLLASISSLILPLDFVLVFYCSTMISRHNRVGTLFFATAEFIFDDWHRFLGVLIGQPCWSAHRPLSAQYSFGRNTTPLSVILYATLLYTTNFLLSIETTRSHIPHLHL